MNLIKKIKNIFISSSIILSLVLVAKAAVAQEITAINFNGEPVGKVIPDGKVVGFNNELLGNITADSLLINSSGKLIGGVVPQGIAIGNDAKVLGKVGSDGSVRGGSGQIIGKTLPNGLVVNDNYEIIGQVIFTGLVYNDNGNVSGRVTGDGLYTSITGEQIGIVMPDGYAYKKIGNDYVIDGRLISSKMVVSVNGDFIGSVVPGGQVTDFDSKVIGSIRANGFVYNEGTIIGKIVNSGYAFSDNGEYMGFVSYNGEVIKDNTVVGKVRADSLISDIKGNIVGKTVDFSATAVDLKGRYLGRVSPDGKVVKMSTEVGKVGARGYVLTDSGALIGKIVKTGPIFDYKGSLKGHALSNGSVIALSGTTIGYMIGNNAYSLSGSVLGSILKTKAVYSQDNSFAGISGVSSYMSVNGDKISVSPLGYVFSQTGEFFGKAKDVDAFYTPYGSILGYQGLDGKVVNSTNIEIGRVAGNGYALNNQNILIGKNINAFTAVDYQGRNLGLLNGQNLLKDSEGNSIGKVLPDGTVSAVKAGNLNYMPKLGQSYYQKTALDFKGMLLGYVNDLGQVINVSGVKVGQLITRGLVIDNSGSVSGHVVGTTGVVNDNCETIGVVSDDGLVYNYRGIYIGRVLANGYVISDSGVVLGRTQSIYPVIGFSGRVVGYSSYNGRVYSEQNADMGCLNTKGLLKGGDGTLLGGVIRIDSVVDYNNNISANSTINGMAVNNNNELIGYQQPNGNVNSNSGISIGYLFGYKFAFGNDNKLMGYVTEDGKVINSRKEEVGNVDFDGFVVSKNNVIGYALYDLYVYDNDDRPVGIINQYGEVISFSNNNLGFLTKGFVVKDKKVVARGSRDYNIRSKEKVVVGELSLNGKVIDNSGNVAGTLAEDGKVINSEGSIIGYATPLQYYNSKHTSRQIIFDENGNFLGYLNENGELVDANGNVIGRLDENGNIIGLNGEKLATLTEGRKIYGPDGKLLGIVDANGNVYDENGNLIGRLNEKGELIGLDGKVIETLNSSKNAVYGPDGKLIGYKDANGNLYDANGNLIGRVDKDGNVYDANGNLIGKVGENGEFVDIGGADLQGKKPVYDANGNLIGYEDANGNVYDASGKLVGRRNSNGELIGINGEVIATDPSINNNAVYDADGNLIGYEDPYGNVYDASGKLVGRRNSNGELIGTNGEVIEAYPSEQGEIVHGPDGKIIGRADAKGNVYDANGKLIGRLNERGELIDDKGNVIGSTRSWFDPSDIMSSIGSIPGVRGKEISETLKTGKYGRSLGIALTPDGEYLGEIMEDDSVVDEDGNIVGYRTPDGLILDEDGEIIGTEDYADDESDDSSSPFIPAGSFGPGGAYGIGSGSGGNLGPGGGYGPGERYDPVRQAALNAAMQERRSNMSVGRISSEIDTKYFDGYQKDWADQGINKSISSWRVDMSEMIFSDKPIPAVIARAIDTNNPAPITAYVERNVYAEEGRNIIIPAGSRLIGAFGSITAAAEATSESARVQITWERLIRPDGSIFVFSGQTADAQGRAGALGYVDQQLFKKYTLPVVTTVLTSAASYFIASAEDSAGEIENSKQQAASDARENFLTDMESLFDDILADKTDVKAMTYIPAGTRIIIYPNSDLWLNSHDRSEEAANSVKLQKPKVFIDDEKELNKIAANESNQMAASTGGSVVYNPDEANVEEAKSVPLIAETPPAKKGGTIAPPPPPPSGGTMAPPPPPSSSDRGSNVSDSSIPALF